MSPPPPAPPPTVVTPDNPPAAPPPASQTSSSTVFESPEEAASFMMQAAFGANIETMNDMVDSDAADWISAELEKPRTDYLSSMIDVLNTGGNVNMAQNSDNFWQAMLGGDDVLRQRMVFALSQILVISDRPLDDFVLAASYYQDILSENAFGNYRDLLEEVTYSPAMADFLTYRQNRKGDPDTGRVPDENYAREILQLFSIGLVELNMDGTPKSPVAETYTNDDIRGLARVFTGLSQAGNDFYAVTPRGAVQRLQVYETFHSEQEKSFLGQTIPANTSGEESIDQALDIIFDHPNVAPFISRQLIQRFTASDPSPDYVERVAQAFESGTYAATNGTVFGTTGRGDLTATLAAILLDGSVHRDNKSETRLGGKVKEPVLKFVQWARNFDVSEIQARREFRLYDTSSSADKLAQHPFRAPSVFNFFRPGFVAPGTESADAGALAPEFQIVNQGAAIGYINFMTDFIYDQTGTDDGSENFLPDYSTEIDLADDPAALIDHLDLLMTAGQMGDSEKSAVIDVITTLPLEDEPRDREERVNAAILLVSSLPSYGVIH